VPSAAVPTDERDLPPTLIGDVLDPVLTPLGFLPAHGGGADGAAQVIFCRGVPDEPVDGDDGCVDLVLDLTAEPAWRIVDVRYWGFIADRWHLEFERDVPLADQLSALARTLPPQLA
jgi:hypothetical protein